MPGLPSLFNHQRYDAPTQQALLMLGVNSLKPWLSLLLATLLVATCAMPAQKWLAAGWLVLAITCTLAGLWYCRHWRQRLRAPLSTAALRRGEIWGIAYGTLVAVLWGSSSQFMHPGQISNLMVAMIYFGVCAGAASISVLGMAHMGLGALIGCVLFVLPLPTIFPANWVGFTTMVVLYHLVILMSAWQRHGMVASNLLLTQEQEHLLQYQRRETARANKASQDKSAFLAAASHDLRQPVHAIMLLGHALQMKTRDPDALTMVGQMLEAGRALSDQFNSLMELSRLESGGYVLSPQSQRLTEFLQRKLQTYKETASNRGIALRLRIDWQLGNAGVCTDLSLLNRIIDNLLDNAIKFSPAGTVVLVRAQLRAGRLRLAIQDQGCGIPASEQDNVFQPHVQLDNPTRDRTRGIGLGLSIVREAVHLLQGELTLHSATGRGSCFMLTLPAQMLLMQMPAPAHVASASAVGNTRRLAGKQLLIVEDDTMVASALDTWATSWGMHVRHHADPATVDTTHPADLIICDIRLPGDHDGIHWLSQWLAEWPNAGGVLVSGEASEAVHERAEQEGLLLLAKPVDPDLLLHTLTRLNREDIT